MRSRNRHSHLTRLGAIAAAVALLATAAAPALAHGADWSGFSTSIPAMLDAVKEGVKIEAIISTGDELAGGYEFETIPDGIALKAGQHGKATVYVNHETSTVPFPYQGYRAATVGPPATPELFASTTNSQNDFDNAQLSRLVLGTHEASVLSGRLVIASDENFQRFCSSYLATAREGFSRDILFQNEEAVDWVNREGQAWPATIGADDARQSGAVVAYDIKTGNHKPIWGMGRLNHENSLALRGYGRPVVVTGDDTFTNTPSQSQVYMYVARSARSLWRDNGNLWAFVSDDPARQRYEDFVPGDTTQAAGHFIAVPKLIATGRNPDGTDLMAADVPASLGGPFPLPPNSSAWQRDPNGIGIDGPQWVLEYWSQQNGVFDFVRVEDMAYDKRQGKSNVVYIVDSGRGTAPAADPKFGPGISTNGRVWKMVLDKHDPRMVESLSILVDGDDSPVKTLTEIRQPDNIESTRHGLYITEDPGSSQQFAFGTAQPPARSAAIWQYKFADGSTHVVATVDQGLDELAGYDVDPSGPGNLGAWEASGIVDASAAFGPGAFLVTVQAHSLWVESDTTSGLDATGPGNVPDGKPDFTLKKEGGQLLLIRIPGG